MPLTYRGDTGEGHVLIEGHGRISFEDWASAIAAQVEDGCWSVPALIDVSDPGAEVAFSSSIGTLTRCVQELTAERGPRGAVAVVLSNRELYRRARTFADMFCRVLPTTIEVFADGPTAVAWLATHGQVAVHER